MPEKQHYCPFVHGACNDSDCRLFLTDTKGGCCVFRGIFDALVLQIRQNKEIKTSLADQYIAKAKKAAEEEAKEAPVEEKKPYPPAGGSLSETPEEQEAGYQLSKPAIVVTKNEVVDLTEGVDDDGAPDITEEEAEVTTDVPDPV